MLFKQNIWSRILSLLHLFNLLLMLPPSKRLHNLYGIELIMLLTTLNDNMIKHQIFNICVVTKLLHSLINKPNSWYQLKNISIMMSGTVSISLITNRSVSDYNIINDYILHRTTWFRWMFFCCIYLEKWCFASIICQCKENCAFLARGTTVRIRKWINTEYIEIYTH